MIEKFKNSNVGQVITISFIVGAIVATIVTWIYESIRIPTLTERVTIQENKIKNLEDSCIKDKENVKELEIYIENIKKQSDEYRTIAEKTTDELSQVAKKLQIAQNEQTRISKELSSAKFNISKFEQPGIVDNNLSRDKGFNFEEAVLSIADREDTEFISLDKYISDLRLISYSISVSNFTNNLSKLRSAKDNDEVGKFLQSFLEKLTDYYTFLLRMNNLRIFATKEILNEYRQKLINFEKSTRLSFFSDIRKKTQILTLLDELVKKLKSDEHSENWNSTSTKLIDEFIDNYNTSINNDQKPSKSKTLNET